MTPPDWFRIVIGELLVPAMTSVPLVFRISPWFASVTAPVTNDPAEMPETDDEALTVTVGPRVRVFPAPSTVMVGELPTCAEPTSAAGQDGYILESLLQWLGVRL